MSVLGAEQESSGAPDWHQAWVDALEALELDVLAAERLLTSGRADSEAGDPDDQSFPLSWRPPEIAAPLPPALHTRAEEILARQLRVADGLVRAMGGNRRELQVARRMDSGTLDRTRPVFVDSQM